MLELLPPPQLLDLHTSPAWAWTTVVGDHTLSASILIARSFCADQASRSPSLTDVFCLSRSALARGLPLVPLPHQPTHAPLELDDFIAFVGLLPVSTGGIRPACSTFLSVILL